MKWFATACLFLSGISTASATVLRSEKRELEVKFPKSASSGAAQAARQKLVKSVKQLNINFGAPPGDEEEEEASADTNTTYFNPERDDAEWPGAFPSTAFGSQQDLMFNIRLDDYPSHVNIRVNVTMVAAPAMGDAPVATGRTFKSATKQASGAEDQARQFLSFPIESFDSVNTLYQIEVTDTQGDGICCGEMGNGW